MHLAGVVVILGGVAGYRVAWLDHRVSDRFFSRATLERSCGELFPGSQMQRVGGRRGVAVIWDAPLPPAGSGKTC